MTHIEHYPSLMNLASEIAAAYLSNNKLPPELVPSFIRKIHLALRQAPHEQAPHEQAHRPSPAVHPKSSVYQDYIICLEDGKKLKTLKRHLKTEHNLTPAQYKERWGLPSEYPMVSPNYTKRRSDLAHKNKLGQKKSDD